MLWQPENNKENQDEDKRLKDEEVEHKTHTIKSYKLAADTALTIQQAVQRETR